MDAIQSSSGREGMMPTSRTAADPAEGIAPATGRAWLLALGFGTTVAMWAVGYVSRIPPVWVPSPVLLLLLLACVVVGGYAAGRFTGRGLRAGVEVGLLSAMLNLLILGSLLAGDGAGASRPPTLLWIPGALLVGAALAAAGAWFGARAATGAAASAHRVYIDWTGVFAVVAASATLCLLIIGGLVTSQAAGLDVPDWPSSFGYNMFLYPLSRMSGGIYYEHSHRLFGSLVGLTTLVLALYLQRADDRRWVRALALGALALVILQGILGGFRVTTAEIQSAAGRVTAYSETGRSMLLRVVHGVMGQLFFATMTALAALVSARWKSGLRPTIRPSASTDHGLTGLLVGTLMLQLVLGALQRHISWGLLTHIGMAAVVLVVAVITGARAAGLDHGQPVLKRLGQVILWMASVQVALGVSALGVSFAAGGRTPPPASEVVVTTAHQTLGGLLLGASVLLAVWTRRLLRAGGAGR